MTVLLTIGVFLLIFFVYGFTIKFNNYTYGKYKYEFFQIKSLCHTSISYALLYFGNNSYQDAVLKNGDILNGQLLVLFGLIGLITLIAINLSKTGFIIGVIGSIFQLLIYSVIAVFGFVVSICLLGFFAQTKPVFNINSKY